jgi:LPXTG-motif cell wall-anchored protein
VPPAGPSPGTATDPSVADPPRLPITGSGMVPVLSATGIVLIALGFILAIRYRRRENG